MIPGVLMLACLVTGEGALRVAAAGSEPFVISGAGPVGGASVEVWRQVATTLGVESSLRVYPGVPEALDAVTRGEADVAVGPISITSQRAEQVAFTQPYYRSSLAIVARAEEPALHIRLLPFFRRTALAALMVLLLVLLGVGTLIWLAERRANPTQFPPGPLRGIGNGIWLALVTLSTVGYGDRAPITLAGRVVTGSWMLISMVTASSLTAGLATAFTLSQLPQPGITSAEQLAGRRVAALPGTTGQHFAVRHGATPVLARSLPEAVGMVRDGKADAVVFDRPQLAHLLQQHPEPTLHLTQSSYEPQSYGFAVRPDSPLRARLDVVLLRLTEEGRIREVLRTWLDDG